MNTNYVNSMTPEERAEQDEIQKSVVMTTASFTPPDEEKRWEEKLRKEWYKCWYGDSKNMPGIMKISADYWLEELSQALSTCRQETLAEVEKRMPIKEERNHVGQDYTNGFNEARSQILEIINNMKKE